METVLAMLGYRQLSDTIWAKPVAHSILIFNRSQYTLTLKFKGVGGQTLTWASEKVEAGLDQGSTLDDFAYKEAVLLDGGHSLDRGCGHCWGFLTSAEHVASLVDSCSDSP